jgi:hypothetical protein
MAAALRWLVFITVLGRIRQLPGMDHISLLVADIGKLSIISRSLAFTKRLPFQPPHAANRHDASCYGTRNHDRVESLNYAPLPAYLRIVWTLVCGLVAVLMVALWIRSYYVADSIIDHTSNSYLVIATSVWGRTSLSIAPNPHWLAVGADIRHQQYVVGESIAAPDKVSTLGFGAYRGENGIDLRSPLWFLVILVGFLGALPWFRRFSLRMLLIATTLVAVGLGTIVALNR